MRDSVYLLRDSLILSSDVPQPGATALSSPSRGSRLAVSALAASAASPRRRPRAVAVLAISGLPISGHAVAIMLLPQLR